jgi:hypothetical protein
MSMIGGRDSAQADGGTPGIAAVIEARLITDANGRVDT